jgi:hypothetical protein
MDLYDFIKASEMCLVSDMVMPRKLKVSKFAYNKVECPKTHLKIYCSKMTEVINDDKLLIHFSIKVWKVLPFLWYISLDTSKIKKWKDLAKAFLCQYKFNKEVASNKSSLQAMKKRANGTIKEYVRHWRETTSSH